MGIFTLNIMKMTKHSSSPRTLATHLLRSLYLYPKVCLFNERNAGNLVLT